MPPLNASAHREDRDGDGGLRGDVLAREPGNVPSPLRTPIRDYQGPTSLYRGREAGLLTARMGTVTAVCAAMSLHVAWLAATRSAPV